MKPDRWQKIEEVFQAVVDLEIEDREKFLKNRCLEDHELRSEVEKLLSDFDSAESFIERPVWTDSLFVNKTAKKSISDSLAELIERESVESLVGKRIGVYDLVQELGRGGMGAVYLGERADGEFRQKVAIKLIKRGMDSEFIVSRFRHERQILASFEHHNIARLLDGGTTLEGLPYFVMEFIDGDSLYDFCDKQKLTLRRRLRVFRRICSAVSYAHNRQIVHRDIKPGNILFTINGVPKLLDFGIAKILDTDIIHDSVSPTAKMMRLMTPDYASPEQVSGCDITFASDIYSLGVLLYELLTGHRPDNFTGKSLHDISKSICEVMPQMPSRVFGQTSNLHPIYSENPERVFQTRNTDLEGLKNEIRGSLDKIIIRALAKDPSERYQSVKELSEDIRRFLGGEEVKAKPLMQRRNNSPSTNFGITGGKALAVLPFKILNLSSTEDTGDQFFGMGLADALITRLSRIKHLIVRPTSSVLAFDGEGFNVLKVAEELGVDYILDGNVKLADERLRVTVQLLDVTQNATIWASTIDEAAGDFFCLEDTISNKVVASLLPQITGSALEEFSKRGTESPEAFEHYLRGRYYFNTSTEEGFAKALVSFHKAIAEDETFALAYVGLADYYTWLGIFAILPPKECFQSAIETARKAVELDENLAQAHAALGFSIHAGNYDWSTAEFHLSRALELNPNYATALTWLSIVRFTEGRFDEGLSFAKRAVTLDPLTPFNHHNLGWGLYFARRFDESIAQYKRVILEFPNYGLGYFGLSKVLRFVGETEEALQLLEDAKKIFGESIFIKLAIAQTYAAIKDDDKTKEILEELQALSDEHFVSHYHLALVYLYWGDNERTLDELEKAFDTKDSWLNWVGVEPVFDSLRGEEMFQTLLELTGYEVFFGVSSIGSRNFIVEHNTVSIENLTTLAMEESRYSNHPTGDTLPLKTKTFSTKRWFYGVLVAIILLSVFWAYSRKINQRYKIASATTRSIAVLPFEAKIPTDENLDIGCADALTNRLGSIRTFPVTVSNSARSKAAIGVDEIGEDYLVGLILLGNLKEKNDDFEGSTESVKINYKKILWKTEHISSDGKSRQNQARPVEIIWRLIVVEPSLKEEEVSLKT